MSRRIAGLSSLPDPCLSRHNPSAAKHVASEQLREDDDIYEHYLREKQRQERQMTGSERSNNAFIERQKKQSSQLHLLPSRTMVHLISFLPVRSLGRVASVCRRWQSLQGEKEVWANVASAFGIDCVLIDFREAVRFHLEMKRGGQSHRSKRRSEEGDDHDDSMAPVPPSRKSHRRIDLRQINPYDPLKRSNPASFLPNRRDQVEVVVKTRSVFAEDSPERQLRTEEEKRHSNATTTTTAPTTSGTLPSAIAAVHMGYKSKAATQALGKPISLVSLEQELETTTQQFYQQIPVMTADRRIELLEKHEAVIRRRTGGLMGKSKDALKVLEALLYDVNCMRQVSDEVTDRCTVEKESDRSDIASLARAALRQSIASAIRRKRTRLMEGFERKVVRLVIVAACAEGDATAQVVKGQACSISNFVQLEMLTLSSSRLGSPLYLVWQSFKRLLPVNDAYYDVKDVLQSPSGSLQSRLTSEQIQDTVAIVEEQFVQRQLLLAPPSSSSVAVATNVLGDDSPLSDWLSLDVLQDVCELVCLRGVTTSSSLLVSSSSAATFTAAVKTMVQRIFQILRLQDAELQATTPGFFNKLFV